MKKDKKNTPIIIKRVIASNHSPHHGGSWKVAYADFVTAMMAFFLLLWLLNSVPTPKLKGIAAYFEPTIGIINKSGGESEGSSQKSQSQDDVDSKGSNVKGFVYGVPETGKVLATNNQGISKEDEAKEKERFSLFESEIKKMISSDPDMNAMKDNVEIEQNKEGLIISITDKKNLYIFDGSTAKLKPYAESLLSKIADLIKFAPNFIAISGYTKKTDEDPLAQYTNWHLSADRANSARRFLINHGIAPEKVVRISGYADSDPIYPEDPYDSRNTRISILLFRNSAAPSYKVAITKDLGVISNSDSGTK